MNEIEADRVHIRNRRGQQRTSDEEIRALLGVPAGYTVLNLVAIGEKEKTRDLIQTRTCTSKIYTMICFEVTSDLELKMNNAIT